MNYSGNCMPYEFDRAIIAITREMINARDDELSNNNMMNHIGKYKAIKDNDNDEENQSEYEKP
jgi:hypothetical protein